MLYLMNKYNKMKDGIIYKRYKQVKQWHNKFNQKQMYFYKIKCKKKNGNKN